MAGGEFPKMANKKPEGKNSERYRKEKAHQEKTEHKKAKKSRDPNEPVPLIHKCSWSNTITRNKCRRLWRASEK